MLCIRAKEILAHKITGGKKLPDDNLLSELFLEAMLFICDKCEPGELLRGARNNEAIYRNVNDDIFLIIPSKPNFSDKNEHLQIDESLSYAVINYVIFLLSQDEFYRRLALETIADYIAKHRG
ncbi:MAG: hypothetical protein LUC34_02170 [Campylobacter sp.]|nr:hypothetical protein [Campylobacter sp.]